jgi:hypothetical protein
MPKWFTVTMPWSTVSATFAAVLASFVKEAKCIEADGNVS